MATSEIEAQRLEDGLYDRKPGSDHDPEKGVEQPEVPLSEESESGKNVKTDAEATDGMAELEPVPSGPPYSAFSRRKKQFIVFMAAFAGFFSPLTANIYYPALNTLTKELHTSSSLINLSLTTYMIFQGLAPTFFGDLADMAGRRPAYAIGFIIYIAANIGIALQDSFAALLVLRCIQSTGSSSTIALGAGVVGDIATSAERGVYMGFVMMGGMVGPAIGPVIGGILAQFSGWQSIFWFLTILTAVFLVPFAFLFPETARKVVGDGSIPPQSWNISLFNYQAAKRARTKNDTLSRTTSKDDQRRAKVALASKRKLRWPNPLTTLRVVFQKDVGLLLFYNGLIYTAFMDLVASAPYLLSQIYGFNDLQIGLCFIPFGVGCLIAPPFSGRLMDWNYARTGRKIGFKVDKRRGDVLTAAFPLERARFEIAAPMIFVGDMALLAYGWVMQAETHLAVPLILHFIMGFCLNGGFNAQSVLLVDLYPMSPATATAANNLVRCWMGAGGTAVIILMIDHMGRGWCFTFIAVVVLVLSPILWVLVKWGPGWREERRLKGLEMHT